MEFDRGLDEYVHNDTLTIQVNASLLCHSGMLADEDAELNEKISSDQVPLYNGLKTLLSEELFVDITIKCGDEEYRAHKAVIAAQSPVFKKMFETNMKEKAANLVEITDTDSMVISEMLTYLYTGSVPKMDDVAKELLVTANKYELLKLQLMCEKTMISGINLTNVMELLIFADSYLKKACLNCVYQNFAAVCRSDQWKQFEANYRGHVPLLLEIMQSIKHH